MISLIMGVVSDWCFKNVETQMGIFIDKISIFARIL